MHRVHTALLAVLVVGLTLGGAGIAGGIDAGVTESTPTASTEGPQHAGIASQETSCSYPVEVTDATGETVVVEEEPEEVVAMGASDAQVMWELGAEGKVTGLPMTFTTAYLENRESRPGGENRTDISGDFGPVVEEVVGLDPDLVLAASAMFPDDVEAVREAGLTVYHAENEESLVDVYGYIEQVGQLVNACAAAESTVAEMRETAEFIEGAVAAEESPTVYYAQIPGDGWTAGSGTVEENLITTAGGTNLGTELGVEFYDQVSEEAILDADPDWILQTEGSSELPESLSTTTAVQEDQIIEVSANNISQPGPRMIEPLETIAEAVHPDALQQARNADSGSNEGSENGSDDSSGGGADDEPDDGMDDTADDNTDDTAGDGDDAADGDGPGLTVVAVLVALGVLVLAARGHQL